MIALSSFQPRRPALWTAICFAAGVALARCVVLPLPVLLGVALTLTVGAAAAALWSARAGWLLAGVFVSLGALRYHTATELLPANHILQAGVLGQPGIGWRAPTDHGTPVPADREGPGPSPPRC